MFSRVFLGPFFVIDDVRIITPLRLSNEMRCFVSQVLVNDPVIVSLCFLSSSVVEITLTHQCPYFTVEPWQSNCTCSLGGKGRVPVTNTCKGLNEPFPAILDS